MGINKVPIYVHELFPSARQFKPANHAFQVRYTCELGFFHRIAFTSLSVMEIPWGCLLCRTTTISCLVFNKQKSYHASSLLS